MSALDLRIVFRSRVHLPGTREETSSVMQMKNGRGARRPPCAVVMDLKHHGERVPGPSVPTPLSASSGADLERVRVRV